MGATTGVSSLILFNFAWNQAPIVGWHSSQVIATLVAGAVVFFTFLWTEYRYAQNPLLPLDAFNADVGFVLSALACGWAMFGMWSLYIVLVFREYHSPPASVPRCLCFGIFQDVSLWDPYQVINTY